MKTAKKVWITVAICLIVLGAGVSMCSLAKLDFNFESLATQKAISNEHKITDDFSNIKIDVDTSDIEFVSSQTDECMVVFVENEKTKHNVTVNNNTLLIDVEDNRKWYDHIGISFSEMSITVHLPKEHYDSLNIEADTSDLTIPKDFTFGNVEVETDTGDVGMLSNVSETLDISTDTGDVKIQEITAQNIILETDTGRTYLTNVNCNSLVSSGDTGDIGFKNVDAGKKFSITRSTGDIKFDQCDADELYIKTSTGDVEGLLSTSKIFVCETSTGDIIVPPTTQGGKCEIITDTGDIRIQVKRTVSHGYCIR